MPKFDVFIKDKKVKVQKNINDNPSQMEGFDYVGSLIGSTKVNALTQAKAKVKQGEFKRVAQEIRKMAQESNIKVETEKQLKSSEEVAEIKKAIYSDFNGVLDDPAKNETADIRESPVFYVPQVACPHKVYKLAKLAIKHQADLVLISDWRLSGLDFYVIVSRTLLNSGIPEYEKFVRENMDDIMDLCNVYPTSDMGNRTDEVRHHAIENEYTHFVVFEDYHFIESDLNPIMVNSQVGLTDEDLEKAELILVN